MNSNNLNIIIQNIVYDCLNLKNKYVSEKDLAVDWVCIFSQTKNEYQQLNREASLIGEIIETTPTGLIYKLINSPQTSAGKPKVLKIRIPDITKPERGDSDFTTNYKYFKNKYLNKPHFTLIPHKKFEMIELTDKNFNVRVYFSSIPPSRLRKIWPLFKCGKLIYDDVNNSPLSPDK